MCLYYELPPILEERRAGIEGRVDSLTYLRSDGLPGHDVTWFEVCLWPQSFHQWGQNQEGFYC